MNIRQVTTWKGEVDRRDFVVWGIILFAVKYNSDRLIAIAFDRSWNLSDYYIIPDQVMTMSFHDGMTRLYTTLLMLSLPFIYLGILLMIKRMRSAKLPGWLVMIFFVPFVNLVFFLILAAVPPRNSEIPVNNKFLDRLIPRSKTGSAVVAVGVVGLMSLALALWTIRGTGDYGWGVFIGIPFFLGFGSVLIYGYHNHMTFMNAIGVAWTTLVFFLLVIFVVALEGFICILMALPLLAVISFAGASIGYIVQRDRKHMSPALMTIPAVLIPIFSLLEVTDKPPAIQFSVVSSVDVDAVPQKVWEQLVAFSTIGEPSELLFRTGIAYPIRAEITGTGTSAIRRCYFTTGPFIEPITVWDAPHVLEFSVLDQPPPMHESSVYRDVEIVHVEGYFKSTRGQFKLEEISPGKTRLTGTTWYQHDVWPASYWKLWSDYILHKIHLRVLDHIKEEAEKT